MGANNVVGVSSVGSKTIVENVGAKRITGAELRTIGKMPSWVYYLVDIDSLCVYANQGADTWIGAFGQPVAGSIELRNSLTPFEGQKYYVVETDISYTFAGGAWEGGVVRANTLAPKYVTISTPTVLTRGRSHVVIANTDLKLPKNTSAAEGDTLNGHFFEVYIPRGISANLTSQVPDTFISNLGADTTHMSLTGGTLYTGIFKEGKWELAYLEIANIMQASNNLSDLTDPATARTNLGVPSTTEVADAIAVVEQAKLDSTTDITAGAGIVKTGTLASGLTLSADFASPAEALDPSVTDKAITPATVASAVSEASRVSQYNSITGLLPKISEAKFLLTKTSPTAVSYPEFSVAFNTDPYTKTAPLTVVTVPAGVINIAPSVGLATLRVKVNSLGVVSTQTTIPDHASTTECFLGTIVVLNGEVAVSPTLGDQILTTPWLASSDYSLRTSGIQIDGALVTPSATLGKVARGVAHVLRESVNWEVSSVDPHSRTLGATDPMAWTYLDAAGTIVGAIGTTDVTGHYLADGSIVGSNKYSIQVAYVTTEGLVGVLLGQSAFNTITDALAQVENYSPTVPSVLDGALEFSRWVVKGDQYSGNVHLDLTNSDNFVASSGSAVVGGTSGGNASDIVSSNAANNLSSTNLQQQIDELANRPLWQAPIADPAIPNGMTPVALKGMGKYLLGEFAHYPVADGTFYGEELKVLLIDEVEVTLSVLNGLRLTRVNTGGPITSFTILPEHRGVELTLVWDGLYWIL